METNYEMKQKGLKERGVLTHEDLHELNVLGKRIALGLSCEANTIANPNSPFDEGAPEEYFTEGFPCRTNREAAVNAMIEYLQINGYEVK
jgi:hypothetical protein